MTQAEKTHLSKVAAQGCALCLRFAIGPTPAQIHHIRAGRGMAQRSSHFLTIPLCPDCHQGPHGIHGDQTLLKVAKCSELDLLADVIGRLY